MNVCRARHDIYVRHCVDEAATCLQRNRRRDSRQFSMAVRRCQDALVGVQGTILTLNCSCSVTTGGNNNNNLNMNIRQCQEMRLKLPLQPTSCTGKMGAVEQTDRVIKGAILILDIMHCIMEIAVGISYCISKSKHALH